MTPTGTGRRWRRMALTALLASLGAVATAGSRPAIAGTDIAYSVGGHGKPVVVLQSGLGDGREVWTAVTGLLPRDATVFAYDRPGYGGSPAATTPRDPCTVATELRQTLRVAGLRPPYVLVGHSLGGLYQFAFAKLHPDEVAALVLLDPTHPGHWARTQRDAPAAATRLRIYRKTLFTPTMRREFDAQTGCQERLDLAGPLDRPAILLTRTRYNRAERGEFATVVRALEQEWLHLFVAARLVPVEGSGHYLQKDRPELVARTIATAVAESRVATTKQAGRRD